MSDTPEQQPEKAEKSSPAPARGFIHRLIRAVFVLVSILVLLLVLAGAWLYWNGNALLTAYTDSAAFRDMLSRQVGKSMKVEGTFKPIVRDGWVARTDGFTSVGLPGQVITRLDAENASGRFNPDGIWKKLWEFDYIKIERATLGLQQPVLGNKPKPKQPKPWYAVFLPTRFYPKVVEAQSVNLEWEFRNQPASIDPMHLFVTPDGINWEFTGTGGKLTMALTPEMWMKQISVHMSKPYFDVQSITFVAMEPGDPAYVTASAKMGLQPADRTMKAHVTLNEVDIRPSIPERLRPFLDAKASGDVNWFSDGGNPKATKASGTFSLNGTRINKIPFLLALQKIHQNVDLTELTFQQAGLSFHWENDVFETKDLVLKSEGNLWIEAAAKVPANLDMEASLNILEMNLGPWLPGIDGNVTGNLKWKGDPTHIETTTAKGRLNLNGTVLDNVPLLSKMAEQTGIARLRNLPLKEAWLDFSLAEGIAKLDKFELTSPGNVSITGDAQYAVTGKDLAVNAAISSIDLSRWLPAALRVHLDGTASGTLHYRGHLNSAKNARIYGETAILGAVIEDFKILGLLARFLKDPGFEKLDLKNAKFRYDVNSGTTTISHIDILSPDKVWITGWVEVAKSGALAGELKLGMRPKNLTWLPDDGKEVFTTYRNGYRWTPIKLGGTMKKPKQDLLERIEANVMEHPLTLLWLLIRLISWILGNWLGYDGPGADISL